MTLMERRRALMMGKKEMDFVRLEYIQSPQSSPKDAMIILPQLFNDFNSVVLDVNFIVKSLNVVFSSWSGTTAAIPYCGVSNNGMTIIPSPTTGRKTYTATKTSTTNGTYHARIGGWNDNTFSHANLYYGISMFDANDIIIADYVFGYLKSTGQTGAYDRLTDTFYPEKDGLLGFTRGPEV